MTESDVRFVEVALDVRVFDVLTYKIPDVLADTIRVGQLVHAPFRNQRKTGLITGFSDVAPAGLATEKIRELLDIVDLTPVADDAMMSFLKFVADYYFVSFSEVLRAAIPSSIRTEGAKVYVRVEPFEGTLTPELAFAYSLIDPEIPVSVLRDKTGSTMIDLAELERLNAVTVKYVDTGSVKEKKTRVYEAIRFTFDGHLGPKQKEILDYLTRRSGPVDSADIREMFESPNSSLKGLEKKGLVKSWEEVRFRDPFDSPIGPRKEITLNTEQQSALDTIVSALETNAFRGVLLHGVTGSGKTEVYLRVIQRALAMGKTAIVLLPEIALTPQFVAVFRSAFQDEIAVLHSGLSAAKKFDQWRRIRAGDVQIVIGARSALFAPLQNVGVIVVDEEHDSSFKQEEGVRYNARDMSLVRGMKEDAVVILGSATPSLESYANAKSGKLEYIEMPNRVSDRPLPIVELKDLRKTERIDGADFLSKDLFVAVNQAIEEGEQSILFLNRRGFSPCILCGVCGFMWRCPSCDVSLTYHRHQEALRCHHCDYVIRLPEHCPECENRYLGPKGVGTEQLADVVSSLLPNAIVGRLDRDAGRGKKMRQVLDSFSTGATNVLVGTQMVTKGHDFPNVTMVGVVHADTGLNFPDFRGAERTFQLLSQVSGRAGRGEKKGQVLIQTYVPEHFSLQAARTHDYHGFAAQELKRREAFGFPPFGFLIAIKFEGAHNLAVMKEARRWATTCNKYARKLDADLVQVQGPTIAPFERLRGKFRWQLLVKSYDRNALRTVVGRANAEIDETPRGVRAAIDVDPLNLL